MVFLTTLLTALCFPTLILLKPLPFPLVIDEQTTHDFISASLLSLINMGLFLLLQALGSLAATYCFRKGIEAQRWWFAVAIVTEIGSALTILYGTAKVGDEGAAKCWGP